MNVMSLDQFNYRLTFIFRLHSVVVVSPVNTCVCVCVSAQRL